MLNEVVSVDGKRSGDSYVYIMTHPFFSENAVQIVLNHNVLFVYIL